MSNSKDFLLEKLVLVGHRKNYTVKFHEGVNIIYGDTDTGKSSILRIIYYMLGGKKIHIDNEIESSVGYAVLEINIGGQPISVIRDLYNHRRDIEVYHCRFEEVGENYPKKYCSSVPESDENNISFSEFLFDELNIPKIKIKKAPTKDDSAADRLSFLDLYKYIYLDQDDIGSRRMMDIGATFKEVKNREVLKYLFNVLDDSISDIENEISQRTQRKTEQESRLKVITSFLSEIEIEDQETIDEKIQEIEEEQEVLNSQLLDLNSRITSNSENYNQFKDALNAVDLHISDFRSKLVSARKNIDQYSRLRNDYLSDIDKISASISSKSKIGESLSSQVICPLCDSLVSTESIKNHFDVHGSDKLNYEINSIKRRLKSANDLVEKNRADITNFSHTLSKLEEEKSNLRTHIDEEIANSISPYITERDAIIASIAKVGERREKLSHALKIRNQQNYIKNHIDRLDSNLIELKNKLHDLQKNAPSIEKILDALGGQLDSYLEFVKINNRTKISVSNRSYLPVVRGIEYRNLNSGGLRTIVSIGYFASILAESLKKSTNLPSLLMIDTVGKFIGKTKEQDKENTDQNEDMKEGVTDPEKYKNIYRYLFGLADRFAESEKKCQIILVDNELPLNASEIYGKSVVAHFSTTGENNLPIGLIDDWSPEGSPSAIAEPASSLENISPDMKNSE